MYTSFALIFFVCLQCCNTLARSLPNPIADNQHQDTKRDAANPYWPYQSFKTVDYQPPVLDIVKSGQPLADGLLFFAPAPGFVGPNTTLPKETAPLIMTDAGELVWSAENGNFATNFRVQTLFGEEVLTYWSGFELSGPDLGHFYGAINILNKTYNQIYKICPDLGLVTPPGVNTTCQVDGHESQITDQSTLVFTGYNVTTGVDLQSVGGPEDGVVWDCIVYEMDIKTQEILFKWSALDHVPINATKNPLGDAGFNTSNPFDYFHVNAAQRIGDNYMINSRHTWSTYMVEPSGDIEWTIEGYTGGDFKGLTKNAHFKWQHDARGYYIDANTFRLQYFNNYNALQDNGTHPSNGLELNLNLPARTVSFVKAYHDPKQPIYNLAQGSNQVLSNGNHFIDFGFDPVMKEFSASGKTLWTATFGVEYEIQTYRGFKQVWHATPLTKPTVVVEGGSGYVSWNGATDVTNYVIYQSQGKGGFQKGQTIAKSGFETTFSIASGTKRVKVAAYDGTTFLRNSTVVVVS